MTLILVLARRWQAAALLAASGLLLGLDTFTLFRQGYPNGDSPQTLYLSRLLPGYFVWLASFGLVLAASLVRWRRGADRKRPEPR